MQADRRTRKRVVVYRAEIPHTSPTEYWEVEYEAVSEALHFACRDLREGRRRPLEILEDGVAIHTAADIIRLCQEREEQGTNEAEPA